jgi:hypothetical protein
VIIPSLLQIVIAAEKFLGQSILIPQKNVQLE